MGEGFYRCRVNDADPLTGFVQKERQWFAISASRFQTGVDVLDALLCQPLLELGKAGRGVGEEFVPELPLRVDEADVEL